MNSKNWKSTILNFKPSLVHIFNELAQKEISLDLTDASTGDEKSTLKYLKGYTLLKSIEEHFQVEVLMGFKGDWSLLFEADDEESSIQHKLATCLGDFVTELMEQVGTELHVASFTEAGQEPSHSLLNLQAYYLSVWTLNSDMGDEDSGPLQFMFGVSAPNEEVIHEFTESMDGADLSSPEFARLAEETLSGSLSQEQEDQDWAGSRKVKENGTYVEFESFDKSQNVKNSKEIRNINLLKDVEMEISVELGSKKMPMGKILQLVKGSVIELDKMAGEPVDVLVNGRCIAQGDVVVVDEHFGVRISKLLAVHETLTNGV